MKIIILVFLLFFSFINITNAFPVAVLLLGYDFIFLVAPFILGIFSAIYFYFRRYIFYINVFLFIINIFLYIYYCLVLKSEVFFQYEWIYYLFLFIFFGIILKYRISFLNYILLVFLLLNFFVIGKLSYDIFNFQQMERCILRSAPEGLYIKFLYKKSYLVVFANYQNKRTYVVIDKYNNKDNAYYIYKNIGVYYSGDHNLGSVISNISINCIK